MKLYCGIDIGGTGVKTLLMDEQQQILRTDFFLTRSDNGAESFLRTIHDSINKQLDSLEDPELIAAGIGCTGPVDINTGFILNPYTLPGLEGTCITDLVQKELQVPVFLDNDANSAHLGEISALKSDDPGNTALIIFGTGVGCSIRLGYSLFRVPGGIHPEIGHTSCGVDSDILCYCGKNNCMENILSGTAINRDALRLFGSKPEEVMDHCDTAEKQAFRENLIRGLVNSAASLAGIFDSRLIFIAGGMHSFFQKYLIDEAQRRLEQMNPDFGKARLISAELGSDSGRLGAAILAQKNMRGSHE